MCRAADHWHEYGGVCNEYHGKSREELEAKVERMQVALERIANAEIPGDSGSFFTLQQRGIARAVLAKEEES